MKIIKLGGSTITDKNVYRKFNPSLTRKISLAISRKDRDLIVVHGAGSFGHISAIKFGLEKPGPVKGKEREIAVVMKDVLTLNSKVIEILNSSGTKAVSVPPHSIYKENIPDFTVVESLLNLGFVPVLYGDLIFSQGRYRIISGDQITLDLAKKFRPESIAFATDVDGLYDADPKKHRNADLLGTVKSDEIKVSKTSEDATGSMYGKIKRIKEMVRYTKKVYIINGKYPERVMSYLDDKEIRGTVIT